MWEAGPLELDHEVGWERGHARAVQAGRLAAQQRAEVAIDLPCAAPAVQAGRKGHSREHRLLLHILMTAGQHALHDLSQQRIAKVTWLPAVQGPMPDADWLAE